MSHETQNDWGSDWSQESTIPSAKGAAGARLREAFANVDPAAKQRAIELGIGLGQEMLKGSGVIKETRDGGHRVSKRGLLKAVLAPQVAGSKALRSGVKEGRSMAVGAAKEQAFGMARNALTGAASAEAWTPQPPVAEWGAPVQATAEEADWGAGTVGVSSSLGNTYNASPSTWVETPNHGWDTPVTPNAMPNVTAQPMGGYEQPRQPDWGDYPAAQMAPQPVQPYNPNQNW